MVKNNRMVFVARQPKSLALKFAEPILKLVVPTRVELVTFTVSRCCSTSELRNYTGAG